ncbi:MAG: hypothetical protein ACO1RT_03065, partial [Planctomycetaceae bacterium]
MIARIALAVVCVAASTGALVCVAQTPEAKVAVTAAPRASYTQQVLPPLRERDPEAALQGFDKLIDRTLPLSDLVHSDLPSAAGALHRSLAQESSGDVYNWLSQWTLPTATRDQVRVVTVAVPMDAPPKLFARSIGERPRDTTFAVASIGPVEGLWCNGWMLLQAANELGQLAKLRVTLKELTDRQIAGAEQLYALSQLVGARGDLAIANEYLQKRTLEAGDSVALTASDINDVAIAAAAIEHPETQASAKTCLARLV